MHQGRDQTSHLKHAVISTVQDRAYIVKHGHTMLWSRLIILAQSSYYFITAVWPMVSIKTFMMVTGPKTDIWLVDTVAVLILGISIALAVSLAAQEVSLDAYVLSAAAAIGLMVIDIRYTQNGTISPLYLLDAAPEFLFALSACVSLMLRASKSRTRDIARVNMISGS